MSKTNNSTLEGKLFSDGCQPRLIGSGKLGGKAQGLIRIASHLSTSMAAEHLEDIEFQIPGLAVIRSDVFDSFMADNQIDPESLLNDSDERIAHKFQTYNLPFNILGELKAIVDAVHVPLAVRSSSMLEDALESPFAGIYATKMIPNSDSDPDIRFRRLTEGIKFVYASTFFKAAKDYRNAIGKGLLDEKMSVIIQEVVGGTHGDRHYPDISGVARSFNYYPPDRAKPEDGIINLALGLGKTIVDGSASWWYVPKFPKANPPFGSVREWLDQTQTKFWAVNMGPPPSYDPINEAEYLVRAGLKEAEYDDVLKSVVSTYDPVNDRINVGLGEKGPRIITFAPILVYNNIPLNSLVAKILKLCEDFVQSPVEIEFAVMLKPACFNLLQVRKLRATEGEIDISAEQLDKSKALLVSERVLGNGEIKTLDDIVFVKPGNFEAKNTALIASQIESINADFIKNEEQYVLIGFGRWGSSDPWLGTPVSWGQISQAKVIVESTLPDMDKEFSQGSHFFHNISSFGVSYFSIRYSDEHSIDWEWLENQVCVAETEFVKHIKLKQPLVIKVDGRRGLGVMIK